VLSFFKQLFFENLLCGSCECEYEDAETFRSSPVVIHKFYDPTTEVQEAQGSSYEVADVGYHV